MTDRELQQEDAVQVADQLTVNTESGGVAHDDANSASGVAVYRGSQINEMPKDLYIPPDALEVFLEHFEGPLDLLLYLIRKQNLDILDIPILDITKQYMEYIHLMREIRFELAAEYLVMAAMLAEIKSRMLLPRPPIEDEEDLDPRTELVRRLQEYERFKQAGEDLDTLNRLGRDVFGVSAEFEVLHPDNKPLPKIELDQLLHAFNEVLIRADMFTSHHVQMEALSVRERMSRVLESVQAHEFVEFTSLFDCSEGRMGVVVTFLAILELIKESLLEIVQSEAFSQIHVKSKTGVYEEQEEEPVKAKVKKKRDKIKSKEKTADTEDTKTLH